MMRRVRLGPAASAASASARPGHAPATILARTASRSRAIQALASYRNGRWPKLARTISPCVRIPIVGKSGTVEMSAKATPSSEPFLVYMMCRAAGQYPQPITSPVVKPGPNGVPDPDSRNELPSSPWNPYDDRSHPGSLFRFTPSALSPMPARFRKMARVS
jgi:hypothetical protein